MGILNPAGLTANDPFCDALDITFPREQGPEVDDALRHFLLTCHGKAEAPGLWRIPRFAETLDDAKRIAFQRTPVVKVDAFGQIKRVSFSGGTCDTFRRLEQWEPMLATLFQYPHRITRLDAAVDLHGLAGPLAVAAITAAGRDGGLSLGRKSVKPQDVQEHRSLDARGVVTGTVYLGKPSREIRAKVYDKRHELEGHGCDDPGEWTRVELTLRKVGATMRDAAAPGALFWNYGCDLLTPPAEAPSWAAGDTGFALPPREELDAWAALRRAVDALGDHLRELGHLADRMGPYGRRMLLGLFAQSFGLDLAPERVTVRG